MVTFEMLAAFTSGNLVGFIVYGVADVFIVRVYGSFAAFVLATLCLLGLAVAAIMHFHPLHANDVLLAAIFGMIMGWLAVRGVKYIGTAR